MKIISMFLAMSLIGSAVAMAQDKVEAKKIRQVVTDWAKAADAQDADAVAPFLDAHFRVIMNRLFGQSEVSVVDRDAYLQMVRDKKIGGQPRALKFRRITIAGSNAAVELEMTSPILHFHSLIQLVQDASGLWRLISDLPTVRKL